MNNDTENAIMAVSARDYDTGELVNEVKTAAYGPVNWDEVCPDLWLDTAEKILDAKRTFTKNYKYSEFSDIQVRLVERKVGEKVQRIVIRAEVLRLEPGAELDATFAVADLMSACDGEIERLERESHGE